MRSRIFCGVLFFTAKTQKAVHNLVYKTNRQHKFAMVF